MDSSLNMYLGVTNLLNELIAEVDQENVHVITRSVNDWCIDKVKCKDK